MAKFTKKNPYTVLLDLGIGSGAVHALTEKGIEIKFAAGKISFFNSDGNLLAYVFVDADVLLPLLKGASITPSNKQSIGAKLASAIKQAHAVYDLNKQAKENPTPISVFDDDANAAAQAVAQGLTSAVTQNMVDELDKEMMDHVAQNNTGDAWLDFIDDDPDLEPTEELDGESKEDVPAILEYLEGAAPTLVNPADVVDLGPHSKVDLHAAHLMYQAVKGTDKNSVYHVVAIGSTFKVAARFTNKILSMRVDWDLSLPANNDCCMDQITEIAKIGFDSGFGSKATHMSMHLDCGTHDIATKALGAVLSALADVPGAEIKTPAPSFKLLMSAAI